MKAVERPPGSGGQYDSMLPLGRDGPPVEFREPKHRPGGWLRFESGGLNTEQTLKNLETVVSLLQKARDGLNGIDHLLDDAMAVVNTQPAQGDHGRDSPEDIARYVATRLGQIDEIVRQCRFYGRGLLDGQSGVVGVGSGVDFIRGGPNTRSSPPDGFPVTVTVPPGRAYVKSGVRIDDSWVRAEEELFLAEGEHFIRYPIGPEETVASLVRGLRDEVRAEGLDLQVGLSPQGQLAVRHNQYGSQYKFKGCSYKTPLLSRRPGKVEWSRKGRDIQGTLGGEPAFGIGRMLIGYLDNDHTSELAVVWQGGRGRERCHVTQNALRFQEGANDDGEPVQIALPNLETRQLGRWMETASGYRSLAEVRFDDPQFERDSYHLMMAVYFELEEWREKVDGWIKRYQNRALACLRKGDGVHPALPPETQVTAEEAEKMALQLRELIQGRWRREETPAP